jgi:DNA-binding NarL/FixJ family response regulator
MVKVIVVDDHPIFRLGLAASLAEMEHVELVGEAATAAKVLDLVERTSPDLVLLDLHLPDKSGLDVNRSLAANYPNVKVVVLTMSEDHHATVAAVRDGARGYIVKGADPTHIEHVIHSVMAGDVVLDQGVAQAMAELAQLRAATVSSPFPQLSPRETDILELIARGLDNQTIARQLVLTPKTVRNHVSNVLAKLNAADRSQAIVIARRSGLGRIDERGSTVPGKVTFEGFGRVHRQQQARGLRVDPPRPRRRLADPPVTRIGVILRKHPSRAPWRAGRSLGDRRGTSAS